MVLNLFYLLFGRRGPGPSGIAKGDQGGSIALGVKPREGTGSPPHLTSTHSNRFPLLTGITVVQAN